MINSSIIGGFKKNIKLYASIVAFATILGLGLGFYIWGLKNTIDSLTNENNRLTTDNTQLQLNVDTVKNNFKVCQDTNITQQSTIDSLLKERKDNADAVATLARAEQINLSTITNLKQKLVILNADAANNGPLAKNLKETIRSIQNKESLQ